MHIPSLSSLSFVDRLRPTKPPRPNSYISPRSRTLYFPKPATTMSYNFPYDTVAPQSFFQGSLPEIYSQDEMNFQGPWQNIDPALREMQCQIWQDPQPLQRWVAEPEKTLFKAEILNSQQSFSRDFGPTASLPHATRPRMHSPTLSQDISSTCSGGSPKLGVEYYHDSFYPQSQESFPTTGSQSRPSLSQTQQQMLPMDVFVPLSQVQVFPDTPDTAFDAMDEEYMEELKSNSIEVIHPNIKCGAHYLASSTCDERRVSSIQNEVSPKEAETELDSEADADAEADEESPIVGDYPDPEEEEEASDTEYSPRSSRPRKRRTSVKQQSTVKKSRVVKRAKPKCPLSCKSCPTLPPFSDAHSLRQHVAASHSRFFVCVFSFAGCKSTFASKNEWKRHVASQHLNLTYWACDEGTCSNAEFNRKDLYTQHLRRMHAPFAVKRQGKKIAEWEERVRELQLSALRERRQPPSQLLCTLPGCGARFDGSTAWDDRMEHVGKHLDKGVEIDQGADALLVKWAQRTGIIERRGSRWGFPGSKPNSRTISVNSDGED